jgi:carbamoyltransferase
MIVLGITDSFTSGAAIVIDGKITAAVSEERLNRNKMCMGFPVMSIAEVIRVAGIKPYEIDSVAVATESLFWRDETIPYTDYFREEKGGIRDFYLSLGAQLSTVVGDSRAAKTSYYKLKNIMTRKRKRNIANKLKEEFEISVPVIFYDHHLCHAASAFFTSGFRNATVITQDGAGDGKCARVYRVFEGKFEELHALDSYDSVGNYYSYVTHLCGFKAHKHEGKITGLAAFGKPEYLSVLEKYISNGDGTIANIGRCFDHSAIKKLAQDLPKDFSHADLSSSIQLVLENSIAGYCDFWMERSGIQDLALAGGVFANVKLNQRVHELKSVKNVFIHPGMGDEGLAVGAALYEDHRLSGYRLQPVINDVYLGGGFSDKEIEAAIMRYGFKPAELKKSLENEVAELLAKGKVVARFDGRMEYGPRALGNRTIMYQPTDATVNDWLNKRLKRTEFMPFAPVTLWEARNEVYKNVSGAEETARFMTITFDCMESMKKLCPAVVHVDGTARPQLIRKEDNPSYYKIVKEYEKLTGLTSVINTSFNMHEEPIVYTPDDALRSFAEGQLDALCIGKHLIFN